MRARDLERIRRDGRRLHGRLVILMLAPGSGEAAFVAGRLVGGAVERNRARRVMRAGWSALAPELFEGSDAVLVARPAIAGARTADVAADLRAALASETQR